MSRTEPETLNLAGGARLPAGAATGAVMACLDDQGTLTWVPVSTIIAGIPVDGPAGVPSLRTLGLTGNKAMAAVTSLDQIAAPAGAVQMNAQRLIGVGDATGGTDALNRESGDARYPQRANNGSDFLDAGSVRYSLLTPILGACATAATANVTSLSGAQTIAGVAAAAGDHVLLTGQTTASQNGPWVVAAGGWSRPSSFPSGGVVTRGRLLLVTGGTNAGIWSLAASTAGLTVDTSAQSWANQAIGGTGPAGPVGPAGPAGPAGSSGGSGTGWGDGSDGAVTLDGSVNPGWAAKSGSVYQLLRDVYMTTLTVNTGVTLVTAGFRVFATVAVVNGGTVQNDGQPYSAFADVAGGAGSFYGSGGATATAGAAGFAGRAAGSGSVGGAGGGISPGAATPPTAAQGGIPRNLAMWQAPIISYLGGGGGSRSGGGGLGGVGGGLGGGGGGGGGIVAIFAKAITNNGAIHARGGIGSPTPASGFGGGGGAVVLAYGTLSGSGTVDANGGLASSGWDPTAPGLNGNVILITAV